MKMGGSIKMTVWPPALGREDDRAEWLAMIKPATPSQEEIKQMRKLVHDTYAAMMERKAQDRAEGAGTPPHTHNMDCPPTRWP